ncbi:DUF4097 family beta strand repeat protein [Candidatus Saccharibacteria bacterium]|nr:DUF4097 family beta strand repeat protein [Candidatus Saccharibacteria bacterium]
MAKNKEKKTFYIVLAVILSVVVLGLSSILIIGIINKGSFRFGFNGDNVSSNLAFEKEYPIEDVEKIDMKVKAGKIAVRNTENNAAIVKFYAKESNDADVKLEGGLLSIIDKSDDCHFLCINWEGVSVELYLPSSYAGEIVADNDFGRVSVDDFREATLTIDSSAGDVELGAAKNIDAKLSMGKLSLADCLGYLRIDSSMGDVEISQLHLTQDSSIHLSMGNVRIDNVGDVRVKSDVSMGNQNINGGNDMATVILNIDNSMGNVSVH